MEKFIVCFFASLLVSFYGIYSVNYINGKKINLGEIKTFSLILLLGGLGTINSFYLNTFIKIIIYTIILFIITYFFFIKDIKKSIILSLISQITIMISEMVYSIILSLIVQGNLVAFSMTIPGMIIINLGVALLALLIIRLKIIKRIFLKSLTVIDKISRKNMFLNVAILLILASLFTTISYHELPSGLSILINTILILIYAIVVYKMFESRSKYRNVADKYSTSLQSLREYEEMMNKYRVLNHENQNQLQIIKTLIINDKEKAVKHIDTLLKDKLKFSKEIVYETAQIPAGGLRATIYTKLNKMKDKKIPYNLLLSKEVKPSTLIKLPDELVLNVCKVISVYIDNAIDAVQKVRKKDVTIEMFVLDNNLHIAISNRFSKNIDFSKVDNKGYSTKGKEHGYGLVLAGGIINRYERLENKRKIYQNIFTQELIIKDVEK